MGNCGDVSHLQFVVIEGMEGIRDWISQRWVGRMFYRCIQALEGQGNGKDATADEFQPTVRFRDVSTHEGDSSSALHR